MYQKTVLLIGILALLAAILFYVAISRTMPSSNMKKTDFTPPGQPMQETSSKTASLYFTPSSTTATSGNTDIMLNTGGKKVSGVQIELFFNPTVVTDLTIEPVDDSLFGSASDYVVLIKSVDMKLGRATLAVGIPAGRSAVGGTGKIATVTFTANGPATISILDKSAVTQLNVATSVLSTVSSFTIKPQ